jgi:hypothetical protein
MMFKYFGMRRLLRGRINLQFEAYDDALAATYWLV